MTSDVYNAALGMLARRDHSRKELERKLCAKFSVSALDLEVLCEALESYGYLNDRRFAEAYTRARMRKGFGPERIRYELREKGVADEIVDETLASEDLDWAELAYSVWQKKYHRVPGDFKEKARQSNFLRYRGFTPEHFASVIESGH